MWYKDSDLNSKIFDPMSNNWLVYPRNQLTNNNRGFEHLTQSMRDEHFNKSVSIQWTWMENIRTYMLQYPALYVRRHVEQLPEWNGSASILHTAPYLTDSTPYKTSPLTTSTGQPDWLAMNKLRYNNEPMNKLRHNNEPQLVPNRPNQPNKKMSAIQTLAVC